jgi:hypothetical protein
LTKAARSLCAAINTKEPTAHAIKTVRQEAASIVEIS